MRIIARGLISITLLTLIFSCEVLSPLLTKNYFEDIETTDIPFFGDETKTWASLGADEQLELVNTYTSAALSIDKDDELFVELKSNKDYKNGAVVLYNELLQIKPNKESDSYNNDLLLYQKRAKALAKIEIFTTEAIAVEGLKDLIYEYDAGNITTKLTQTLFLQSIYGDIDKDTLITDLKGCVSAGLALELLGETIVSDDNPKSNVLFEDDAIYILSSLLIKQIVVLSETEDYTKDAIIDLLASGIISTEFSTVLKFPQDLTLVDSSNLSIAERYLGVGGAKVYTATGYELPDPQLLYGGNL
ncbi:MAG: hypothetical protein JXR64_07275 [Spirochaetales bacterium]|nr:hypothetical protein [Spirochaetales bacterium]